jgi:hypothetical protein
MPLEEYYALLKAKYKETDWDDLESIKAYNEYARELRHMMDE